MKQDDKKSESDAFYVAVTNATEMRRAVLETARAVVYTVHVHNRVRDLQDEKLKLRTDLAHVVRELKEHVHKLETVLPHRDVSSAPLPAAVSKSIKKATTPDHRLDKIEAALSEIEQRMKNL
jgi:hypothetical protein